MIIFEDDGNCFSLKKDGISIIESVNGLKSISRETIFRHDFYMRSDQREEELELKKLKPEIKQLYLDCKKSLYTMITRIEDVLREDDEKMQKM